MINHVSGRQVWDVMFDLAVAAGFAVMPGGCRTCVVEEASIMELPEGVPEPIVIIGLGQTLLEVVESA